jgi:hypothetical protein
MSVMLSSYRVTARRYPKPVVLGSLVIAEAELTPEVPCPPRY